jgi:PiT family inorganic phosphate transporter
MGVGMSRRLSAVRWKVVASVVGAWVLTLPASALIAFVAMKLIQAFTG